MIRLAALIPARSGSERIIGKNLRELNGHPLIAYAIGAAQEAAIFDGIWVSSDDPLTLEIAEQYGATPILRPLELAHSRAHDMLWVRHALEHLRWGCEDDAFAIIRPTSPFRRGPWIAEAWDRIRSYPGRLVSIRAMREVTEHPGKMWRPVHPRIVDEESKRSRIADFVVPLLPFESWSAPWHSMPTQDLPTVFVQNGALEIAWSRVVLDEDMISALAVIPYLCAAGDPETIDINTEADWARAVIDFGESWLAVIDSGEIWLPEVRRTS